MTNLIEYGKGRSPSEIQYEPGAELVEELERKIAKLKELLKEVLRHDLSLKEVAELTRKISEVLGEE